MFVFEDIHRWLFSINRLSKSSIFRELCFFHHLHHHILIVLHVFKWTWYWDVIAWWIPRVIMIHGLAYTHYWYAPYFIDPYFIDLWTATSVHLETIVAHQMLEDFLILSMLILLLMIACCWTVSRWFTYGQQWTFRIMTYYHHYHHYYHRDDCATGKVHYRTFNVWGNNGSYEKILWQCYGDIHGRTLWH